MKAIETRYTGPTNTRPARIIATDGDNRVIVPADNPDTSENIDEAHDRAARALCKRLNWTGTLARGHTKRGNVYVWLNARDPWLEIEANK